MSVRIDRGQLVASRQRDDQIVMQKRHGARRQNQIAIGRARKCRDGALDLAGVAPHIDRVDLHPERRRHGLDDTELADSGGYDGIPKDRRSRHAGRDLLEQFQPFAAQAIFEREETGGVAARPRQAVDEAGTDRIADVREHDRHGAALLIAVGYALRGHRYPGIFARAIGWEALNKVGWLVVCGIAGGRDAMRCFRDGAWGELT